jgi:hypothetical protein
MAAIVIHRAPTGPRTARNERRLAAVKARMRAMADRAAASAEAGRRRMRQAVAAMRRARGE